IPKWLLVVVGLLYAAALGIAIPVNLAQRYNPYGNDMFPPELRDNPVLASFALAGIVTSISILMATFIFLTAYVNRDASRRGMNSALWTILLLIFLPTWGLIGFVIYFLMREPLPYPCPLCRALVTKRRSFPGSHPSRRKPMWFSRRHAPASVAMAASSPLQTSTVAAAGFQRRSEERAGVERSSGKSGEISAPKKGLSVMSPSSSFALSSSRFRIRTTYLGRGKASSNTK